VRLDAALRAHHPDGDARVLGALHIRAAALLPDPAAQRFHLTHAWVYALVAGDDPQIADLESRLRALDGL
jgi:hypothetical protein